MGQSVTPGKTVIVMLTFSIWHFKCQVSAMTTALYNLNAHCLASFLFFWDEKDLQFWDNVVLFVC